MPARRSSRRSSRGPRRRTQWENASLTAVTLGTGALGVTDMTSGWYTNVRAGITLLRTLGSLSVRALIDQLPQDWAFGIIHLNEEEAAANAFPEPFSDTERLWVTRIQGVSINGLEYAIHGFDVKAKRLFRRHNDRLYAIMETGGTGNSVSYAFGTRNLYALP